MLQRYGVDSLTSMDIQNWIDKNYHTTMKISEILAGATIQTLTDKILTHNKSRATTTVDSSSHSINSDPSPPPATQKPVFYPVSHFQEGVLMQTMFYGSTCSSFNVAASTKVENSFSISILQRAVDVLVRRHKLFFAHFSFVEGQFQMQISPYKRKSQFIFYNLIKVNKCFHSWNISSGTIYSRNWKAIGNTN